MHLYFDPTLDNTPIKRMIKVRPDLDILGDGGYVVAPPSIHPETNKRYMWVDRVKLVPFPLELLPLIVERRKGPAEVLPDRLGDGRRDELLTSLSGSMRRRGASEEAILAAIREENASRCDPPLEDKQLKKIAKSIARKAPAGLGEHFTDLGNARRFIEQHKDNVRCILMGTRPWKIWDGSRWASDTTGEIERYAKGTVRMLYQEAAHVTDPDTREQILKHAAKSESASRITALIDLASTEPEVALTPDMFDSNHWLLNVENGTINLKTGEFYKHRKEDLMTQLAPIEYQPSAKCPRWDAFMLEVFGGDADLVKFTQKAIGYALTGDTREQCLFFAHGQGSNGKSTFLEIIRELFGSYAQQADFTTFLSRKGEGPRNDLARMRGARLVTSAEASGDRHFDETTLKQLTGGDTIVARKLYEEHFEFKPQHKLFLAANHKPIVKEQTEAFWRRIRMIPFTVTFAKKSRDKMLSSKLRKELPGILNWAIAGCLLWQKEGLPRPKAIRVATESYRDESDLLGEFLDRHVVFEPGAWSSTTQLYNAFTEWWAESRGARSFPLPMGWFTRGLGERAEVKILKRNGIRGWLGVSLKLGGEE
jgi:putative DNA primase/helicase